MPIDTKIEGDPAAISGCSDWVLKSMLEPIMTAGDQVFSIRNAATGGWVGIAADAFKAKMSTGGGQADDFKEAVSNSAQVGHAAADALRRAQDEMRSICQGAAAAGLEVRGDVIMEPKPPAAAPGAPAPGQPVPPEVGKAQQDAQNAFKAQQAAYDQARAHADDVGNRWRQAVEKATTDWGKLKEKAFFTTAGLGVSAGTVAAKAHESILLKNADEYAKSARQAIGHANAMQFSDPVGAAKNADFAEAQTKAAAAEEARAGKVGSLAGKVGYAAGAVGAGVGIWYDIEHGKPAGQAVASGGAGFAASVGVGAAAGTVIGGPVGTAVGAVGGVVVGAFTSGAVDSAIESGGNVAKAAGDGVKAVGDTGSAIGSLAADGAKAVGSGVKDVWNSVF